MKATEQYLPVVLFIMLYEADLTFKAVDEILKCDHSKLFLTLLHLSSHYFPNIPEFPHFIEFPTFALLKANIKTLLSLDLNWR